MRRLQPCCHDNMKCRCLRDVLCLCTHSDVVSCNVTHCKRLQRPGDIECLCEIFTITGSSGNFGINVYYILLTAGVVLSLDMWPVSRCSKLRLFMVDMFQKVVTPGGLERN
ncbi:hypothetical protein NP493_1046g00058 [Ridgeia piscesae]|uniref:Uncharacterized protein n=1 Tax=Ridgeia piscesae TaxID=27915 RepID=A0AAD9KHU3_RIDPI|nr:hypothetical protein NP493_1046g00058 [Ridgeia piscesae]